LQGTTLERLGTAKFLGSEPMQRHDAVAYIVNGIRYKSTGRGFRGGYARRANIPTAFCRFIQDSQYWFEEVIGPDGARICLPVSISDEDAERPCCGVIWVFPPTLTNPNETTR